MPWSTSYLPDADVVETVSGVLPPDSLQEAVRSTLVLAQEHGTKKLLGDCSALEGGHSIIDLYQLVKLLETVQLPPGVHEAIVLPQLDAVARDVRFWETACRNRGVEVRVFPARAEALAWLAGDEAPRGGSTED